MSTSVTGRDTIDVTANTAPTASITASDDTVCAGESVNFSVSTNMPDANYQWKVGTTNVGANKDTFSYIAATSGTVSCVVTKASGTCFSPSSKTADTTMVVIPNTQPIITISDTANGSLCPGSIDSFTASTNIIGATYQWKVNANNTGVNDSTHIFTPANNDQITCVITTPTGCFTQQKDTSNTITITNLTPTVPTISILASINPVCIGTQVTFNATTNIPAGTYKWKVGGSVVGGSNVYSYAPANNDQVSCTIVAPNGCYIPDTGNSNIITMTVNPKVTPTITITGPTTMGEHGLINLSANLNNAGNSYTIDWKNNGNSFANTTVPSTSYSKAKGVDNIVATITPAGCYNSATSNTLVISEAVSINPFDNKRDNILVYPNPTRTEVHIEGLLSGDVVELFDAKGRKLLSNKYNVAEPLATMDLSNIAAGIYLLEVRSVVGELKTRKKLQKL